MKKIKALGIYREQAFSNHAIDADKAIMDAALDALIVRLGDKIEVRREMPERVTDLRFEYDLILSMAQNANILRWLEDAEKKNSVVVNPVQSIKNCYRLNMLDILDKSGVLAPSYFIHETSTELKTLPMENGAWMKRGDFHALSDEDVVYVSDLADAQMALNKFKARGIDKVVLQEHIQGPIYKFYGVRDHFFMPRYMGLAMKNKENLNSREKVEMTVDFDEVRRLADVAATDLKLDIYGGDCIIDSSGKIYFIDMNDWPSFRTCKEDAAKAMAHLAERTFFERNEEAFSCPL